MIIIIYFAAMFAYAILRHQARRHNLELGLEYELLGMPMPQPKPKIPLLESLLMILLGTDLVVVFGYRFLQMIISMEKFHDSTPPKEVFFDLFTTTIATGITMIILGILSLHRNRQYAKRIKEQKALEVSA